MDRSVYDSRDRWGYYTESSSATPGFHALLKLKQYIPVKAYDWYRIDADGNLFRERPGKYVTQRDYGSFWSFSTAISTASISTSVGGSAVPCVGASELQNIVQNKLLNKVRNVTIDLGVVFGERNETAHFIASVMKKVALSYHHYRHGNLSSALRMLTGDPNDSWKSIPKVASNAWLAYTYGLRPLLKDAYDAARTLENRHSYVVDLKTVRASSRGFINGQVRFVNTASDFGDTYTTSCHGNIQVRSAISFRTTNPITKTLDQLGVLNPLSVAWELVPFSFVVDWFIPVGDFVRNIVPPQGVDFVDGWISTHAEGTSLCTSFFPPTTSYPNGIDVHASSVERIKHRKVLTEFPSYHLVIPDVSLSNSQIASGIALLLQQLV